MSALITAFLFIYILLITGLTMLLAWRHHWIMAVIRSGIIVVSLVVSAMTAKSLAATIGGMIFGQGGGIVPGTETLTQALPLAAESLETVTALVIAPVLFFLIFILLRLALSLLAIVVEKCVPTLCEKRNNRLTISLPVGAVNGLAIALITLIPLCCTMALAGDTLDAFFKETEAAKTNVCQTVLDKANFASEDAESFSDQFSTPLVEAVALVGSPIYDYMTTDVLSDGQTRICLGEELPHFSRAVGETLCAVDAMSDGGFGEEDKEHLFKAGDTIFESDWVAALSAEALREAAESWRDGISFLGMNAPNVSSVISPTLEVVYDVLATESVSTVKGDLHTVLDLIGTLLANGFFDDGAEYTELLTSLAADETGEGLNLKDRLLGILSENPHMAPLADEIHALTRRVVSSVLSSELQNNQRYEPVIADITSSLNVALSLSGEEREEGIRRAVQQAFDAEGIAVPEDLAVDMSEDLLGTYGADGELEEDEVRAYLVDRIENDIDAIEDILDSNDLSAFVTALENE